LDVLYAAGGGAAATACLNNSKRQAKASCKLASIHHITQPNTIVTRVVLLTCLSHAIAVNLLSRQSKAYNGMLYVIR